MIAPRLPGRIEGLIRRCSPVTMDGATGVACGAWVQHKPRELWVLWNKPQGARPRHEKVFAPLLGLDLTDATGRAHAAWWLVDKQPPTALFGERRRKDHFGWVRHAGWKSWGLARPNGSGSWFWATDPKPVGGGLLVPALNDLDPESPRLLEDGSRWVDAEALRLVVLHVAGVSS